MIPRHLQIAFGLLVLAVFVSAAYVMALHSRESHRATYRADGHAMSVPSNTPAEPVTLCVAYDDEGVLIRRSASAALPTEPGGRARELLRALFAVYLDKPSPHPIGEGSDVNEVFVINNSLAVVDLNAAFARGHRSGVWEEALTVDSIVATLAANMHGLAQVKILIDGQERDTLAGHADLMTVYRPADVNQLVQ